MPKKIDDILHPKSQPDALEEALVAILTEARRKGLAMTKRELFQANRFNWFDVAPVGEGGILLTIAASMVDAELGVSKAMDERRERALAKLVQQGRVTTRESEGETYYWLSAAAQLGA